MAVMATEQPQAVSVDQKTNNDVAPEKDKMAVDEPVTEAVTDTAKAEEAPATNGKSPSPEQAAAANQQAFAANNGLSTQSPAESSQAPATEDSEMKDVNGSKEKEPESADSEPKDTEAAKEPSADSEMKDVNGPKETTSTDEPDANEAKETKEEVPVQAPASPPQTATPKPAPADDAMDIDTSAEDAEVPPSKEPTAPAEPAKSEEPAEPAKSEEPAEPVKPAETAETAETVSDKKEPTSSQEISQSADVAKLEIKSPREDVQDVPMADPTSTGKISRERSVDEDGEDEPLAKRTKLDAGHAKPVESPTVKASDNENGASAEPNSAKDEIRDEQPIKEHHSKEMRKELARVKKTKNGMNFRQSVEKLWPGIWENYKAAIDHPVDLALFESKFRDNKYSIFGEFKADLVLLNENAFKFNGPNNPVSQAASRVSSDLLVKWSEISKMPEPAKAEKGKAQPTRHVEHRAATQPRRQSQSQAPGTATSPKPKKIDTTVAPAATSTTPVSTSAPAFALPPNGVPQIRRDSTRDDADRPKRPIHPPKNRDPDYGAQNARKKKLEPEMRFYAGVLEDLKKGKYWTQNQWFLDPVDPVALNIPNYFQVIKKPMDLKTMTEKLEDGKYRSGKDVEKDMRQIVANSELFNGASLVTQCAQDLENLFKEKVAEKANWMAKNYPPSAPSLSASAPSPDASDAESEDESEPEADENSESVRNVQSRLSEEQVKLNDMLAAKKPDMTMIEVQQNVVSLLQRKLVEEKSKVGGGAASKKAKAPKKSASKPKSKSGASQGASGSGSKKALGGGGSSKNRPAPKKPQSKKRSIGPMEKTVITEGISELDGPTLDKAVDIIKKDTNQKEDDDGQLELDIEVLTQDALIRLFELINKSYPAIYNAVSKRPEFSKEDKRGNSPAQPSNSSKPKKNKPMNKDEQERKIEQLRELKAQFQRQGSGSQEPVPEDEEQQRAGNSSEDSDSEEE